MQENPLKSITLPTEPDPQPVTDDILFDDIALLKKIAGDSNEEPAFVSRNADCADCTGDCN